MKCQSKGSYVACEIFNSWKLKVNIRFFFKNLLVTVRSTELTSALNVPPHTRSSHVFETGRRSETRAQPINSQSAVHEFGVPCDPPPTIELTMLFELPDNVNDCDRLWAIHNQWILYETFGHPEQMTLQYRNPHTLYIECYRNSFRSVCKCYSPDLTIVGRSMCRNWSFSPDH